MYGAGAHSTEKTVRGLVRPDMQKDGVKGRAGLLGAYQIGGTDRTQDNPLGSNFHNILICDLHKQINSVYQTHHGALLLCSITGVNGHLSTRTTDHGLGHEWP